MTVDTANNRDSSAGNSSVVTFTYTFRILDETEILVTVVVDSTGVETVAVLNSDYTVAGVGDQNGGTITFTTAPATGETVVRTRLVTLTQQVDLVANGPLPAESVEAALDRTMMAELSLLFAVSTVILSS